jgi:hypothetical protein
MKPSYSVMVAALGLAFVCCSTAQAANPADPSRAVLTAALNKHLARQGDFCVGKFDWPIDVAPSDFNAGSRDAVQMPALEKIGLVTASIVSVEHKDGDAVEQVQVKRYDLTEVGKMFYLKKEMPTAGPGGTTRMRHGDFCAGKLSLDKVVGWDKPALVGTSRETTVTYTYRIAAAQWTRVPEIQKVFPMVTRVVQGERTMQLKQRFRLAGKTWEAVPPWE